MTPVVAAVATATALVCALAVAACGLGAGPTSSGTATLTVTRNYGSRILVQAKDEDPPSSETVIRFLDSQADITTRYGGGFVQSIDGLSGTGSSDWFFYVNGLESPVGSADVRVKGGDKIWWDYRDWTAAMSVPAVVGQWPEPFAQASSSNPSPVRVVCLGVHPACSTAANRLADAGVKNATVINGAQGQSGSAAIRLLVGPWRKVGSDPAVDELRGSPQSTGVFATFKGPTHGRWHLVALDPSATPVRDLGSGAGLVAALGRDGENPTWIVTGSGGPAVRRASRLLDGDFLHDHYAVAATRDKIVSLPVVGPGGGSA
jgi:hypothetical protein